MSIPVRQVEELQQSTGRHGLRVLGRWVLGLGLALAGGAAGPWIGYRLTMFDGDIFGIVFGMVVMCVMTLLAGAALKTWWALLVLPLAVYVGMAVLTLALWGWPSLSFVFPFWRNCLVPMLVSMAAGVGVGRLPWNE